MIKKFKNIIALNLVLVFMIPMTVKFLDGTIHEHYHFNCTAKNEAHLHEYHEECSIPSYKLSFFSLKKYIPTIQKYVYPKEINDNYNFICNSYNLRYSFLLRAPPIFTDKIFVS